MTKYTLIGLIALFGCTATDKDTGDTGTPADTDTDTDTDTDEEVAFALVGDVTGEGFSGVCATDTCVYTMTTTRPAGTFNLMIAETADTKSDPIWSEEHTAFTLVDTMADGSEKYEIRLAWVTALPQVDNQDTLLNPTHLGEGWADRLTWNYEATSPEGDFDCAVTGHMPSYYDTRCTYVVP